MRDDYIKEMSQSDQLSTLTLHHKYRASVVFAVQSWLGESEETRKNSSTPGYFSVGMSCKLHIRRTLSGQATTLLTAALANSDVAHRYLHANLPTTDTEPWTRYQHRSACGRAASMIRTIHKRGRGKGSRIIRIDLCSRGGALSAFCNVRGETARKRDDARSANSGWRR
jgi:hypothetical protein